MDQGNYVPESQSHIVVVFDDQSTDFVSSLSEALAATGKIRLTTQSLQQMHQVAGMDNSPDCVLVAVSSPQRLSRDTLGEFTESVAPAPVLLIGDGIAAHESAMISSGVEDCLDTTVMPLPAILRAMQRCMDRAAQRVHVRTAERRYEELFDRMPISAFRVNCSGGITAANKAFLRFMGTDDVGEVSDTHLNGLLTGLAALQTYASGEVPDYNDRHILETVAGDERHVMVSARATQSGDCGRLMEVYLTDVTEQQEQTRRIVEAENRLRDLYDNVPIMMFAVDGNMMLREPNKSMLKALGREVEDLEGVPATEFLHETNDPDQVRASAALLRSGQPDVKRPMLVRAADGSAIECLFTATPKIDTAGRVIMAHAMLVDMTAQNRAQRERDELQEQLQLTQKLESIGELAAGIAHEINTPAQYVSDNLSFLADSFGDLNGVLDLLPAMIESLNGVAELKPAAERLQSTIDDADVEYLAEEIPSALSQGQDGIAKIREIVLALKDFSHPGSGAMEPADINRIIESTVTVARNEWKYVAEIHYDLDPFLPLVDCFPSAIAQVVLNIVVNAAHAIGEKREDGSEKLGAINISTQIADPKTVCIRIRDNGPGIPESIRRKIFDPFFTTKEVGRGTGQGLAISRSVVMEQHGGTLSVESEEGKGSEFRIELPLASKSSQGISEVAA